MVSAIGSKADMLSTKHSIRQTSEKSQENSYEQNVKKIFGFEIYEGAEVNEDLLEELSIHDPDAAVDKNGNIAVYHRTTAENAKKIYETGTMTAKEDGFYGNADNVEHNKFNTFSYYLVTSEVSDNKNENSIMFHALYAYTNVFGYPALLRLRIEELYNEGHGKTETFKRDYILQNIEEEVLSSRNRVSSTNHEESTSSLNSISDLYALVKKYDKDFTAGKAVNPAMLNEDGTPKGLVFTMLLR